MPTRVVLLPIMRIQFCGADRTVTGSSHLIECNGTRILLDCGMYQGPRQRAREINEWLPSDPAKIDAVILSHGHLDHCGKLPVIVRAGFRGPIYATPATIAVARIVLEDAGEIQEENAEYLNQRRGEGDEIIAPLFKRADVHEVFRLFKPIKCETPNSIGPVKFLLSDAGHILGSTYVKLDVSENGSTKKLLFTADIGRYNTPIIRDPTPLTGAFDYIITESTYGDRTHAPMDQIEPQFLDAVKQIISQKGRLIVPSFAVGRTQTMLWYLQRFISEGLIPKIRIYVDSPMGVEVSQVTTEHRDSYDEQTLQMIGKKDLFCCGLATFASSSQQSREINADRGPCVIIASSPTCEFGRVLHHLKHSVEKPSDMVLFVGWIPPYTLGRRLQDGQKRVKILDRWYDVRCAVRTLHGLSAHADGEELLRFLAPTIRKESRAFVVHGEAESAETFAKKLQAAGMGDVTVPAMETSVEIGQ